VFMADCFQGWKHCLPYAKLMTKSSSPYKPCRINLPFTVLVPFRPCTEKHTNKSSTARYFRPPFGTVGVRLRQQLAQHIDNPYIVNWSVDVEDWLWGNSTTPERQLDAFYRDVARGGNLAVMHYLNPI